MTENNNEVLAMYDVRGIQKYVFNTNKVKEIMGASYIVRDIVLDGIKAIIKDEDPSLFLYDWENSKECAFLTNPSIQMEVLFIGGGNAYVLFRNEELCHTFNRKLAKYILDKTYLLNLAIAVVPKTDNYVNDYNAVQNKMRDIKATMPETKPMGAFSFMATDNVTGQPLTYYSRDNRYVCTESYLKLNSALKENIERTEFDQLVTEKGDNSFLALVHIDGNNMGLRIKEVLEHIERYEEAIPKMRELSSNIKNGFEYCYHVMEEKAEEWTKKEPFCSKNKSTLLRQIVLAGDDITFVCNARIALSLVSTFLKETVHHQLVSDKNNPKKYAFSACAGIAFFNSHYPFSDAYKVAEECCSSAKKRAKEDKYRTSEMIGCYFDYEICTHISSIQLDSYREKQYIEVSGNKLIIQRPYYVPVDYFDNLNQKNKENSYQNLEDNIKFFSGISRSRAKTLRNKYTRGYDQVNEYIDFLKSRNVDLTDRDVSECYDALELLDLVLFDDEMEGSEYGNK